MIISRRGGGGGGEGVGVGAAGGGRVERNNGRLDARKAFDCVYTASRVVELKAKTYTVNRGVS